MKDPKKIGAVISAVGIFMVILDGKTALQGALQGVGLCIGTVIPVLFPFFLLTGLLSTSLMGEKLPLLRPLGRFLRLPEGAEALLIPGFLGGYPAGARAIGDAVSGGWLSREDGERLLFFGSNAGPAFLFGMTGLVFSDFSQVLVLWAIHAGSALFLGALLPEARVHKKAFSQQEDFSLSRIMNGALHAMAAVCGWVILFRMILAFLNTWFLSGLSPASQALVSGLLELTNGTVLLSGIREPSLRFILCSLLLAWGGGCVAMQTLSVSQGLPLKNYLLGRFFGVGFSLLFSLGVVMGFWPFCLITCLLILILTRVREKSSGNSLVLGV